MKNCEHCQDSVNNKLLLTTTSATAAIATAALTPATASNGAMKPLKSTPKSGGAGGGGATALAINATDMIKAIRYTTASAVATTTTASATTATTLPPAITTARTTTPTGGILPPLTTVIPPSQLCQHLLQQHQNPQRCSSVGSASSSICETVSSDSGLAMSPTEPQHHHHHHLQLQQQQQQQQNHQHQHQPLLSSLSHHHHQQQQQQQQQLLHHHHMASMASTAATKLSRTLLPSNATRVLPPQSLSQPQPQTHQQPTLGLSSVTPSSSLLALAPPPTQAVASGLSEPQSAPPPPPPQQQQQAPPPAAATLPPLVGGLGAAAMAANLAESFSLLHQQAHHFRDILYAAHLLGRGYYQPAGPLISPHVIQPVTAGPPPPIPPNVPLLTATNTKLKSQTQSTSADGEHITTSSQPNPANPEGPESELLISSGGDLTPYRYPPQSGNGSGSAAAAAAAAAAHHSQQQQQHQLQQQAAAHAAAAAAAAAAHQSSPYPRSMHPQMHYSTAYPANYYSPYPGEPMCYSPPAYQPYFPAKVYQSAPPPPHHSAYRRYPYYQPGHPPPPADLYEQAPPPPPTAGGSAPPPTGAPPTQAGQPPPAGTQLVPAGPAGHSQHLEHYQGPPGYYPSYSAGGGAAGQCYTRSIQAPYMEYPPQCPCPMQQSCPKNVHTGPHIGSNSNNNSSSNCNINNVNHTHNSSSNNSTSVNISGNNSINSTPMINHCSNNNSSLNAMSLQHNNSSNKSTSNTSTMNSSSSGNHHNNSSSNSNSSTTMMMMNANSNNNNVLNTNRGPVKNVTTAHETRTEPSNNSNNNIPLLSIAVKTELSTDDTDNKSQYEENVVTPLTPPDSYSTNEEKLRDSVEKDTDTALQVEPDVAEVRDKLQTPKMAVVNATAAPVEAYDLTTSTPPLASGNVNPILPTTNATQQSPQLTVGRRARIGKSMVWNMVYAGAAAATHPNGPLAANLAPSPAQPCPATRPASQPTSPLHSAGGTTVQQRSVVTQSQTSSPQHNVNSMLSKAVYGHSVTTKQEIEEIQAPLLLKAEIKSEKIKLEDDILDTMLLQHSNVVQHGAAGQQSPQKHIMQEKDELKIIKAEPITLSEILNESKVKIEHDCEILMTPESKEHAEEPKQSSRVEPLLPKTLARMRLLPSWQQPIHAAPSPLPAVNCDIDLSNTSDDEVLDLCHSPVASSSSTKSSGKRIKILEFNKNQCKKSPPNSYKSLIKQAEPKMYLCLSRKFEKKSRFGRLHSSKSTKGSGLNNGGGIRRRELLLTDQQKESLKLRKKKLAAIEKHRRAAKEQRRAQVKQKRREAKAVAERNKCEQQETVKLQQDYAKLKEEDVIVNLVEDEEIEADSTNTKAVEHIITTKNEEKPADPHTSPLTTPKPSPKRGKPPKKPAIPLHLIETIDAVARGYFSEPECRTSSTTCSPSPMDVHKPLTEEVESRKAAAIKVQKKTKSTSEKRSKSETKKPLKAQDVIKSDLIVLEPLTRPVLDVITTAAQSLTTSMSTEQLNTAEAAIDKGTGYSIDCPPHMTESKPKTSKKSRTKEAKQKKEKKHQKKPTQHKSSKKSKTIKNFQAAVKGSMEANSILRDPNQINDTHKDSLLETNNNDYDTVTFDTETLKESQLPSEAEDSISTLSKDEEQSTTTTTALAGTVDTNVTLNAQNIPTSSLLESTTSATAAAVAAISQVSSPVTGQTQLQSQHSNDSTAPTMPVFIQPTLPPMPRVVCHSHHQHAVKRNRSRSKFGARKRQKLKHSTVSFELDGTLPPATRMDIVPKWNNGWTWEGEQFQGAVFLNSDDPLVIRTCYPAMRHVEGDIIRTRDCVLLKANEDNELPYVAKVAHLWENPEDGEMMMSLLWYYRPEHTEQGRQSCDSSDEVYASRHRDHNSVACIEDKCYVLTFSEYCRYRRRLRAAEEDIEDVNIVPKRPNYYSIRIVPDNTNPELVMFCRRAYEFRTRRLLKMPNKQDYYVVTS